MALDFVCKLNQKVSKLGRVYWEGTNKTGEKFCIFMTNPVPAGFLSDASIMQEAKEGAPEKPEGLSHSQITEALKAEALPYRPAKARKTA